MTGYYAIQSIEDSVVQSALSLGHISSLCCSRALFLLLLYESVLLMLADELEVFLHLLFYFAYSASIAVYY